MARNVIVGVVFVIFTYWTSRWIDVALGQLVQTRTDGSTCKGNIHCISKCCYMKRGAAEGMCVTPPAGTQSICGEQVDDASGHFQTFLQHYLRQQQNSHHPIIGADQRRQVVTQGPPFGFGGFPGQLVTTASQGTTVTGAFVYVCSTCESKCCCGTTCCDASVCTAVGTTAAAAITGTLCTGCNSLCCCGAQCCAASYCGLPNVPAPMPPIQATGVAPVFPPPPPGPIGNGPPPPHPLAATHFDADTLAYMYMAQMAPYGVHPMQQQSYASYPYLSGPSAPPYLPPTAPSGYGYSAMGPPVYPGNAQAGFGSGMRRKIPQRPKRRVRRASKRWSGGWGSSCPSCCPGCLAPPSYPSPSYPPPPYPPPSYPPPLPAVCASCPCGCCRTRCCVCGVAPALPPPPAFPPVAPGCVSCQCGCCGMQCCGCTGPASIPPWVSVLPVPPPAPVQLPAVYGCSNCYCGCCGYQCCACPPRYPTILPLQPLAPRYPVYPVPPYGSNYIPVPAGPPPPPPVATTECTVDCSCGCCGQVCCACKDSVIDAAMDDAFKEIQTARDEAKSLDKVPL